MKNTPIVLQENEIDFQLMHRVVYYERNSKSKLSKAKKMLFVLFTTIGGMLSGN